MPAPFFSDHALSARVEAVEAAHLAKIVRAVGARLPALGATMMPVAGGVAAFFIPGISISRAVGLGMSGPVTAEDIESLVRFYHARGSEARLLASPFADVTLFERLGERGFRLAWIDTVLVRRLRADERFAEGPGDDLAITVARPEEAGPWVATSLANFGVEDDDDGRRRAAILEAGFETEGVQYLTARRGGEVAGSGGLHLHERTAFLFAASTAEAHRGRGVQAALIRARLDLAREAGCDMAFASTAAGSASQRNFERLGFLTAYSQALMIKPLEAK